MMFPTPTAICICEPLAALLQGNPEMREANKRIPTFLYAMPFSPTKVFLEETSLVARPAVGFQDLKDRLAARCGADSCKLVSFGSAPLALQSSPMSLGQKPQPASQLSVSGGPAGSQVRR